MHAARMAQSMQFGRLRRLTRRCAFRVHTTGRDHVNAIGDKDARRTVYWHRELPPLDAELLSEHVVEASSPRVSGRIARRDDLWNRCYDELMATAERRLVQEVGRLGGDFAHVYEEVIDPRHDDATAQGWLHGCFGYMLDRRCAQPG